MMKEKKNIFLFAGEPSGDLHGSHLIEALRNLNENLVLEAVAGPLMRKQNIDVFMQMEQFAVMGFTDVILALPSLIKKFYKIRNHILKVKPDAVILIDYPGFNLRLATHLRKKGYTGKIIQYICPTVWAWGKNRIEKMSKSLDLLLTIYPFEKEYFLNKPIQVEYIGHPVSQTIQEHSYTNLDVPNDHLIALFPGSREAEIKRNLTKILESAVQIKQADPETKFAVSIANDKVEAIIYEMIETNTLKKENFFFVPKDKTYELMRACRTAIAKSGTVTLELALHKKPTVVVYELTRLNRFIAKYIMGVSLPFYCIVNILKNKEIFPELIEKGFTSEILTTNLKEIHREGKSRDLCIQECENIKTLLQSGDAHEKAASSIMGTLSC
jgi:lipid-A-disaccharide synthase